ncbi:alkylphosphonate utilization protein [Planktotalea sp.]|uniref:alkylphosphonate utilization protein n=1 Tax=Planktotalea sp. TaxID=2029877 RepID=UPI00329993D9
MTCALCSAASATTIDLEGASMSVPLCESCVAGVQGAVEDAPHWQCLHDAIWSTEPATQIAAFRALKNLEHAVWARDLLEIAYLEPEVLTAAQNVAEPALLHRDSNGAVLSSGDTVVLIKDLPVKGAGFTAKRGTAVRNISLVADNAGHIEGRVESQRIVILTEFVKKSGS